MVGMMWCARQDVRFRGLSLGVSLLLLLSLIGARYHMANVSHGHCSKHGQPVHLSGPPPTMHPTGHTALQPSTHHQIVHHCALLEFLTQSSLVITDGRNSSGVKIRTVSSVGPEMLSHVTIPLLRQSPKASPPQGLS